MAAKAQPPGGSRPWRTLALVTALVVAALLLAGNAGLLRRKPGELVVNAVAHQWWWGFDYPALGIVRRNDLHIPDNRPVRLILTSADVIHSFIIPSMKQPVDVVPGAPLALTLVAKSRGTLYGSCKSSCGSEDECMTFKVAVTSAEEFSSWVDRQQKTGDAPTPGASKGANGAPEAEANQRVSPARHLAQLLNNVD